VYHCTLHSFPTRRSSDLALQTDAFNSFDKLHEFQITTQDWIFGYLSYDLKNDVEDLHSQNIDGLHFPDLYFFQPKKVFLFFDDYVEVSYLNVVSDEMESDWEKINETSYQRSEERR